MTLSFQEINQFQEKLICLHSMQEINAALDKMAKEITEKLHDQQPLVMTVLNGSIIPAGHLSTRLDFPLQLDYMHLTRYQGKMHADELHWLAKPRSSLKNRTILIIEDVLDAGTTLSEIIKYCEAEGAKKIYTAVIVDKKHARAEGGLTKADFTGLVVDDLFLVGFGLDYQGYFRNLPGIYAFKP